MSIESDLKKDGITVIEPLDTTTVNVIAKNVSKKIVAAFSNLGFDFDTLYERFSKLPMYIADMPEGMSEASYFYKNSAIYFRDGMGLADLEKFAVHELIHNFQEQKNEKGDLTRLGLCTFKGSKPTGMALNEAAVQLLASNILENTFETATYYDITFSTVSPNCYPLLCNLIYQMAYVTGEEVLFESTFNSNDHFKNKFTALCGENVYNQISNYFDKILETEEKIIKISNKMQKTELSTAKVDSLYRKSDELKNLVESFNEQLNTNADKIAEAEAKSLEYEQKLEQERIEKMREEMNNNSGGSSGSSGSRTGFSTAGALTLMSGVLGFLKRAPIVSYLH